MKSLIDAVGRILAKLTNKTPHHARVPSVLPHDAKYEDFVRPR
ncbi:MAG TPA: hypothetical protein VHS78_18465 [Candidatus Elarobacter sp.]|jgi:hypothetical protein|nr:hypothetical protein [Candidatus Elarobacter sp.]